MRLSTPKSISRWQRLAGNRRLLLSCLLLFIISAILSFWTFFPAEVVQRRLVQEVSHQSGLQMTSTNSSLLFPLGIEMDLKIIPQVAEMNPLELQKLQVTPAWSTLFSKSPAIDLQGGLAGGDFSGQADRYGNVQLEFNGIDVGLLENDALPYRVTGQLQGRLNGEQLSSLQNGKCDFDLRLSAANVLGLERFGLGENFSLGKLEVQGKFHQQRLNLERVSMTDGLIEMSGGGNLLIGGSPQKTRLNLNIRLHPTQKSPQALRDLLSMTGAEPTADGSYLLRIGGTLARPAIR